MWPRFQETRALMLACDHALRGPNDDRLGTRFPDMTRAYAPELRELVRAANEADGSDNITAVVIESAA